MAIDHMTRDDIVATVVAIERRFASKVQLWRVLVDATGQPTGKRVYRCSFNMPTGWQPPSFADLMTAARTHTKRNNRRD